MDKTVVVVVDRYKVHPKYKKRFKVSKKYMAHDETNASKEGDQVTILETRPLSKRKRWRVISAEEAQTLKATRAEKKEDTQQIEDTMLIADFEVRKRAKTRGQRIQEKSEKPATPEPKKEAPASEAK